MKGAPHLRPFHRKPVTGDDEFRLKRCESLDGLPSVVPIDREVPRRTMKLGALYRSSVSRLRPRCDKRIADDHCSIELAKERNVARRVTRCMHPTPCRHEWHRAVLRKRL